SVDPRSSFEVNQLEVRLVAECHSGVVDRNGDGTGVNSRGADVVNDCRGARLVNGWWVGCARARGKRRVPALRHLGEPYADGSLCTENRKDEDPRADTRVRDCHLVAEPDGFG